MTLHRPILGAMAMATASLALAQPVFAQTKPTCSAGDAVVWENPSNKTYYLAGNTYSVKSTNGNYACRSAATKNGYKAIKVPGSPSMSSPHMAPSPSST